LTHGCANRYQNRINTNWTLKKYPIQQESRAQVLLFLSLKPFNTISLPS
jgi:hypothetical protein